MPVGKYLAMNLVRIILYIRDHSFSTFAKFSEKLLFLTPWWQEILDFRKILPFCNQIPVSSKKMYMVRRRIIVDNINLY